jgi:hypothetical protein
LHVIKSEAHFHHTTTTASLARSPLHTRSLSTFIFPIPRMKASTLARVGLLHAAAAEYIWPSKYDLMEDLLYLQSGYIRRGPVLA